MGDPMKTYEDGYEDGYEEGYEAGIDDAECGMAHGEPPEDEHPAAHTIARRVQSSLADVGVKAEVSMYLGNVRILVDRNTAEQILERVGK